MLANFPKASGNPSVACIGETMVSLAPPDLGPLDTASELTVHIAGAEFNVAMYLADLGVDARWVSRLGDDPWGRRVLSEVSAGGVDTSGVELDPTRPTGIMFKSPQPDASTRVIYYRSNSAASAMDKALLEIQQVKTAAIVHLSGITPALSATCAELVEKALNQPRSGQMLSFDVNYRPALWQSNPAETLLALANAADLVFVGRDEAETLWGTGDAASVRQRITRPHILVVKDAEIGATALVGDHATFVPSQVVEVVEPVGAGDAFAAGFLTGLLRGADAGTALRLAHLTAASALQVAGDHGVAPGPEIVAELLNVQART